MATKLDDAIIEVKIDTRRAEEELRRLQDAEKKVRGRRRESTDEDRKREREEKKDVEKMKRKFPAGQRLDAERAGLRLASAVPIAGAGIAAAALIERFGGVAAVRGLVEEMASEDGGFLEQWFNGLLKGALNLTDEALQTLVGDIRQTLVAVGKTATDAAAIGKVGLLTGWDPTDGPGAENVADFLKSTYAYQMSVEGMQRRARNESMRIMGQNLGAIFKSGRRGQ